MKHLSILLLLCFPALASSFEESTSFQSSYQEYIRTSKSYQGSLSEEYKNALKFRQLDITEELSRKIQLFSKSLKEQSYQDVAFLEAYLKKHKNQIYMDENLLMQVMLLYFKKANFEMEDSMQAYQDKLESYYRKEIAKAPEMPSVDYTKTIHYAKSLLKSYPRSEYASYSLYLIGSIEEELGNLDKAKSLYQSYLTSYPYSPLTDEVVWRLAEILVDYGDRTQAYSLYKKITNSKDVSISAKAIYKLAAMSYQDKNYKACLGYLKDLDKILISNRETTGLFSSLEAEFLEYLGLLYIRGLALDSFSEDRVLEAVQAVAKRLERHNQRSASRELFKDFIKNNYLNPQVPSYYFSLIQLTEEVGDVEASIDFRRRSIAHLSEKGNWWKKNQDLQSRFQAIDLSEESSLFLARYHAERALEKNQKKEFLSAKNYYQALLSKRPGREIAGVASFELAQVEKKLKNRKSAIRYFWNSIEEGVDRERAALASYNYFVLSVEDLAYQAPDINRKNLLEEKELSLSEKDLVSRYESIQQNLKYDQKLELESFLAKIYASRGQLEKAELICTSIIDREIEGSLNKRWLDDSAKILQEIYLSRKDWKASQDLNQKLRSRSIASAEGLEKQSKQAFKNAKLTEASEQEEAGDLAGALANYMAFAIEFPSSDETSEAKIRAAIVARKMRNFSKSNDILRDILKLGKNEEAEVLLVQNLLDSFEFSKIKERYPQWEAKTNNEKLNRVLTFSRSLAESKEESFVRMYQETQDVSWLIQALKDMIYQGKIGESQAFLAKHKKAISKQSPLAGLGVEFLIALRSDKKPLAEKSCATLIESYAKLKSTSTSIQSFYFQCDFFLSQEKLKDLKQIEERLQVYAKAQDVEALAFADIMYVYKEGKALESPYINRKSVADSSIFPWYSKVLKIDSYKNLWAVFPYHILRADEIPWENIKKAKVGELSAQRLCQARGYSSCYKTIYKLARSKKLKSADRMLAKIALILDNDLLAKKWLKSAESRGRISSEIINDLYRLDDERARGRVLTGKSSAYDYLILARSYYQNGDKPKAEYAIQLMTRYFSDSPLVRLSSQALLSQKETGGEQLVLSLDPREEFLRVLVRGTTPEKKSLHQTEWKKSLSLVQKLQKEEVDAQSLKMLSRSVYTSSLQMLMAQLVGDKNSEEIMKKQIRDLAEHLKILPALDVNRGVANE